MVGDIATMNQAFVSGEIDFHMTGGTYSASPARADGFPNLRGITPKTGPIDGGKGGVSWIEITSVVNNPQPLAAREEFLAYRPGAGHRPHRRLRRGHLQPGDPDGRSGCFDLFTAEELDAIQWDCLEEEMARSAEYDIVPDYDAALDLMTAAKRAASGAERGRD